MMVDRRPRFIYAARKVALPLFYLFLWTSSSPRFTTT
ncbi:hypothetical protein RHAL1_02882 [Beijerinckiaceae bacterium RH AL1]|nr:hypothetical protein RHAL1_02882 [Beijerinckiaceae bacterium RH AL1]